MSLLRRLFTKKQEIQPYQPMDLSEGETVYLTKEEKGQFHHFRATVKNNGVDVVHGIFYTWLGKYFQGCGDRASALKKQKQLIDEKIKEGFSIMGFKETPENTEGVYDKAKWHFGGDFPKDLDDFQGYVHTGLYLGWLIDTNLVSDEFKDDNEERIALFKQCRLSGPQIFEVCCDGVLMLEDLNEMGNRFSLTYFNFTHGQYLSDYQDALGRDFPSLYYIADTWDNYQILKQVLDQRFAEWQAPPIR